MEAVPRPNYPLITPFRGIGALGVFFGHAWYALLPAGLLGWGYILPALGVQILGIVAGFLTYRPYVGSRRYGTRPPRLLPYLSRRVLRIGPPYWVCLTIVAIWPGLVGVFGPDWWAFYGFAQIYTVKWSVEGIPPAWFLCVLMTFYAMVPLWAWGMRALTSAIGFRRALYVDAGLLLVLIVGSLVMRAAYVGAQGRWGTLNLTLVCLFYLFGVGMLFALANVALEGREADVRAFRLMKRWPSLFWAVAIGLCAVQVHALNLPNPGQPIQAFAAWKLGVYAALGVTAAAFMLMPIVWGTKRAGLPGTVLRLPGLAFLGLISYGIYIWHTPVLRVVQGWGWVWDLPHAFIVWGLTSLAVTVGVASISWFGMERYLSRISLEWQPRRGPRLRVAPAPAG